MGILSVKHDYSGFCFVLICVLIGCSVALTPDGQALWNFRTGITSSDGVYYRGGQRILTRVVGKE